MRSSGEVILEDIAVQFRLESLRVPLVSLGFSERIRPSQNQVHHRDTEGTERKIHFFVHREIPMDEKDVSNQIHDTAFFKVNSQRPCISKSFVHDTSNVEVFG